MGSPIGAGHLLEVFVNGTAGSSGPNFTITDGSGGGNTWHYVPVGNGIELYYCYNCAGGSYGVTATDNNSGSPINYNFDLLEWSGVLATSNPLDQYIGAISVVGSGSISAGSVTTTANGELISVHCYTTGSGAPTVGTGMTSAATYNGVSLDEYQVQTTAGAINANANFPGFGYQTLIVATYFAASGGGGGKSDVIPMIGGGRRPSNSTYIKMREDERGARETLRRQRDRWRGGPSPNFAAR
jgi:hypothetical protein